MKHGKLILLCLLMILLMMPAAVQADMGAPMMQAVDCVVSNPNGAEYYVWPESGDSWKASSDRIPYGTSLSVTGEFFDWIEVNGVSIRHVGSTYYNDVFVYIQLDDVQAGPLDDALKTAIAFEEPRVCMVVAEDGISVYSGPSTVYDQAAHLPFGSIVTFLYGDESDDYYMNAFNYCTCGDVSGWVMNASGESTTFARELNDSCGFSGSLEIVDDGVFLLKGEGDEAQNRISKVPVGTALKYDFYMESYDGTYAYVDYEGQNGFVRFIRGDYDNDAAILMVQSGVQVGRSDRYLVTEEETKLYTNLRDLSALEPVTLPKDTILGVEASFMEDVGQDGYCNGWYLVDYEGYRGYVLVADENSYDTVLITDNLYWADSYDPFTVYTEPSLGSDIVCTCDDAQGLYIIRNTYNRDEQAYFVYVIGEDFCGWANGGIYYGEFAKKGGIGMLAAAMNTEVHEATPAMTDGIQNAENNQPADNGSKVEAASQGESAQQPDTAPKSDRTMTLLIIACIIIAALTATVIILLISRKKEGAGKKHE